ncbi:hypothetical protein HID58_042602, partial [Brassica napus]
CPASYAILGGPKRQQMRELVGVDILLLDEKGTLMQGSITAGKHSEDDGTSSIDRLPHRFSKSIKLLIYAFVIYRKIPCREANKDPIFFATLKQQLIIWENITHQDKVQPGSATDGSSQANDIDGKKKAKRAEVPTNTCQFPPIKSMDVSQH